MVELWVGVELHQVSEGIEDFRHANIISAFLFLDCTLYSPFPTRSSQNRNVLVSTGGDAMSRIIVDPLLLP